MSTWKVEFFEKPKLKDPILIEGLPGIGNIGKLAVDFIIDELKAKKLLSFFSYSLPHSVFINEKNLVELPTIELYYKQFKGKKNDLLLLAGDIQPMDEHSCYAFSDKVLDIFQEFGGKEIITIGGIAMRKVPENPLIYCTANHKEIVKRYIAGTKINNKLYGVVGPIIGVTGVMLGLASRRKIKAISLLSETYGHPLYLGVKGAREIIKILNSKLSMGINIKSLDKEIQKLEQEVGQKTKEIAQLPTKMKMPAEETRYIG